MARKFQSLILSVDSQPHATLLRGKRTSDELYKFQTLFFEVHDFDGQCVENNTISQTQGSLSVSDPSIMVAFPKIGDPDNAAFVAWTITPWTLPNNLALCVNANFVYVKVRNKYSGKSTWLLSQGYLSFQLRTQSQIRLMNLLVVPRNLRANELMVKRLKILQLIPLRS
ncbi:isoleucine--tRNA ligase-like [Hibiscus syriacus]|uniref:isoleucine--tRNA ligase-like n=1 Tax=Hibiscus syriacus TaxID=106335 RepID=UPI00192100AA|nr:isoleucine--tRNA ligase-like [Hibiscus syriacus]